MLRRQGFHVFYPVIFVEARVRGKLEMRRRPLFPRYLFVSFDIDDWKWRSIRSTYGVSRLLGGFAKLPPKSTPGPWKAATLKPQHLGELAMPIALPEGFVEHLQNQPRIVQGSMGPALPSLKNQTVRVKAGPFQGFEGVCSWSEDDRVRALLSLFGRDVEVNLRRQDVQSLQEEATAQ